MKLIIIENQKIFDLNEKLKEKEKEIKKIRNENNRWNKMLKILI